MIIIGSRKRSQTDEKTCPPSETANETGQTSEIEPGIKDEDQWQQHLQSGLPLGSDDSSKCMTQKYMVEKKPNCSGWDFQ